MKHTIKITLTRLTLLLFAIFSANLVFAQDEPSPTDDYKINTLFAPGRVATGGFGAITNKFTFIDGHFANLAGIYGGVYLNHSLFIGASASALTNNILVPVEDSESPLQNLSYMYGQVGGMAEYVLNSDKAVHLAFNMFTGAGFTLQYDRTDWENSSHHDHNWDNSKDEDWFFVAEPGVTVEFNVLKWMRFSPGVSYRAVFNSDGRGLGDSALSNVSYNLSLKFGKF
jgi:hypothetical protein